VVIIKSVLSATPVYFLSFFKAPAGIISKLECIFKKFLWGGSEERKLNWVKWEKVCRPLEEGGLGIKNLRAFNLALLSKWEWKIRDERAGLWYRALGNRYEIRDGVSTCSSRDSSLWWRDICNLDHGVNETLNHCSVKEIYRKIMSRSDVTADTLLVKAWHKSIPSKVSCFVWRLFQNRIATKDNLCKRGVIDQRSIRCLGECGAEESITHLFFECPIFAGIWYRISNWLRIPSAFHNEGMSHMKQFEGLAGSGRVFTNRICVIWFAAIWSIWKARNDKLFKNKEIKLDSILESVKRLSWHWLRFKARSIVYDINQWCLNPRACLGIVDR
jgi:hypothetical protein